MKKIIFGAILSLILLVSILTFVDLARAPPVMPHQFYGSVKDLHGYNITDGIQVTAMVIDVDDGSTQNFSVTVSNGWYDTGQNVTSEGGHAGDDIWFYIGGINTSQMSNFSEGGTTNLDLTIDDTPRFLGNNSSATGTTGDPFTVNVTIGEYVDSGNELTVSANWSHGSSSGNASLSYTGGNSTNGFYYAGSFTLYCCSVENVVYTVYANDTSGDASSYGPHSATVTDNDDPVTTLQIGGPVYPAGTNHTNVSSSSIIYLNTTDNIGQFYVHYRTWNTTSGWSSWTVGSADTNSTITLNGEGLKYAEYYANDTANNVESTHNVTMWVDNSAPTTTLSINEQVHPNGATNGANVTSSTTMTLSATDSPSHSSGVSYSQYRYWNSSSGWTSWNTYSTAFMLGSDEGAYYLEYRSIDNLGNTETANNVTIWVDNSAPTTTLYVNEPVHPDGATNGANVSSNTTMTLSAVDSPSHSSGVLYSQYRYWNASSDWTSWTLYSSAFTLGTDEGRYYLEYRSVDNLSHTETANNASIWIDKTAPTSSINNQTDGYYSYFQNATLTITATAGISSETNGCGLGSAMLYYWYNNQTTNASKINGTWVGPVYFGVNSTPWVDITNISWDFNFTNGTGYYRFCSVAYDNLSNSQSLLTVNDTNNSECFYNNTPPNLPSSPSPSNGYSYDVGSKPSSVSWTGGDVDGDAVSYTVYLRDSNSTLNSSHIKINTTSTSYSVSVTWSTTYYWKIVATDEHGAVTEGSVWSFTVNAESSSGPGPGPSGDTTAPTAPTNVRCTTSESDNTPSFSWNASTDSSGISGYYVKIDDGTNTFIGNVLTWTSTTAISDGTHTFYVKAKDASTNGNQGSYGTCSFTISTGQVGQAPVANAGGPYEGLTYENVTFDGANSSDDETIQNYTWNFGDGNVSYGVTPTHRYSAVGLYNVTLTVTDNDGLSATNRTTANITLDSDGDGWSDEVEESYDTDVTDPNDHPTDTDGDGVPNDSSPDGKYLGDSDDDDDGLSDETEQMLGSNSTKESDISSIEIEGITYYLIDTDGDGQPDKFYNPINGKNTTLKFTADGKYLIDMDGDGKTDYVFDPSSGVPTKYEEEEEESREIPGFVIILLVLGAVIAVIIIIIAALFKIGYLYIEEEPVEKEIPKELPKIEEKPKETKKKPAAKKSTKPRKKK